MGACRTSPGSFEPIASTPPAALCSDPYVASLSRTPTTWVGIGDFDGDGHADLASAGDDVAIAWGDGSGDFTRAPWKSPSRHHAGYLAVVADFDLDGRSDLVLANRTGAALERVAGDAQRIVTVARDPLRTPALPTWLGVGSTDAPDLAVVDATYPDDLRDVFVLLARSRFMTPTGSHTSGRPGAAGAVGNLFGDQDADVAVAVGNGVDLFDGVHSGVLPNTLLLGPWTLSLASPPSGIALGDFDHDQRLDVAAVIDVQAGANVFVWRNLGDAHFSPTPLSLLAGRGPVGVVALDWNLDGHLDLAVANGSTDHSFSLFYGRGDGTFTPSARCDAVTFDALGGPVAIAAGDLDGDGDTDLAFAYYDGATTVLNRTR